MFNSGGTLQELECKSSAVESSVTIKVKGGGKLLAYSSESPRKCCLNGAEVAFEWTADGKLNLSVPWFEEAAGISNVVFVF
jgi:stachyose synthetase